MTAVSSVRGVFRGSPERTNRREAGFTLVELVVTIAILGILAAIAIPSFTNVMPKVRLGNAVQKLSNEIAMARMTAISRSVDGEVVLQPLSDSYYLTKSVGGVAYANSTLTSGILFDHAAGSHAAIVKFLVDDSVVTDVTTLRLYANGTVDLFKAGGVRVPWDLGNQKTSVYVALQAKDGIYKRRVVVSMMGRIYTERWAGGTSWVGD